ncbi:hypothetical protein [Prochlorococcus marinus]|uniref:hypothetical protein n=1 Tax=Prochlorococcus marinus TaxID=1219 RepID=UPI0039B40CB2
MYKHGLSLNDRYYNFEKKSIKKTLKKTNNISFLIVEGIFAKEFANTLNIQNYYFLEIKNKKNECMKRVLKRDLKERGKNKNKLKMTS